VSLRLWSLLNLVFHNYSFLHCNEENTLQCLEYHPLLESMLNSNIDSHNTLLQHVHINILLEKTIMF